MNKAFVKETGDDETLSLLPEMPLGVRNYITPAGYRHLQSELQRLMNAAQSAGAHDENSGNTVFPEMSPERSLRDLEQSIHYLQARLETAEIVDPGVHAGEEQIFFGANVIYQHQNGKQQTVTIVGLDELDPANGRISWLSPVAQSLLGAWTGDEVTLESPAGKEMLKVRAVHYPVRNSEPGATAASSSDKKTK